jgi:hypothetical protein
MKNTRHHDQLIIYLNKEIHKQGYRTNITNTAWTYIKVSYMGMKQGEIHTINGKVTIIIESTLATKTLSLADPNLIQSITNLLKQNQIDHQTNSC